MSKSSYVVKSIQTPPKDILGNKVDIDQGDNLSRIKTTDGFIKIFSNGSGTFKGAEIYE